MPKVRGSGVIEKDKRYRNTWKITFYLGEKDEQGRYKRAPKRTIHGSKGDAREALAAYIEEYEQGTNPANQTIGQYARRFHELREGDPSISPLSYKRETIDIDHVCELLGDISLGKLTPGMVRTIEAEARKEGDYSESALHKMHQKLRQVMQDAYLNEIVPRNAVDLVPFPRPRPKENRKSLTPDEAARLFQCAEAEGGVHATGLMLLIATGMRRGEMLGLMWGFVDLDGERIFIARQYDTDKNLREPKTEKSKRWVSINDRMADILRAWKAQQAGELVAIGLHQTEETTVFANELGQFIDPNNYARWWRNFSVDNGFGVFTKDVRTNRMNGKEVTRGKGYEGLKLHELRHTQATLIQGAVSPKAAQHRLGHSQISMTMNTYAHALDADEIAAPEAMDRILGRKNT